MSAASSIAPPADLFIPTPRMLHARIEQLGFQVAPMSKRVKGVMGGVIWDVMQAPSRAEHTRALMACVDHLAYRVTSRGVKSMTYWVADVRVVYDDYFCAWVFVIEAYWGLKPAYSLL